MGGWERMGGWRENGQFDMKKMEMWIMYKFEERKENGGILKIGWTHL